MKRIWASLILFVLLVSVCVLGNLKTKNITADMVRTVSGAKAAQQKNNSGEALRLSEKAVSDWRADHRLLCTFMPHSGLEAIDQTLSGLPELCRNGTKDGFLSECDKSLAQFSYLTESEVPSIENIF